MGRSRPSSSKGRRSRGQRSGAPSLAAGSASASEAATSENEAASGEREWELGLGLLGLREGDDAAAAFRDAGRWSASESYAASESDPATVESSATEVGPAAADLGLGLGGGVLDGDGEDGWWWPASASASDVSDADPEPPPLGASVPWGRRGKQARLGPRRRVVRRLRLRNSSRWW